jgi:hypothetical protein
MANVINLTIRANDDTQRAFDKMNENFGRAFKNMAMVAASAAPQLFGPIIAGAGATAAALASAGIATAAFGAAVVPQLQAVKKASEDYTKVLTAQDKAARMNADAHALAAKGGKEYTSALSKAKSANLAAKDAQDAYTQSLGHMPKATQDTAIAFAKLKDSFQKWSDSLAPKTMPIFTKALDTMRGVLPSLTPLVETASNAFSDMMDRIGKGVKGDGFKSFMRDMDNAAKSTLPDLLKSLGNIGVGFAGVLQAFLPFSTQITGGLEHITEKFREWGQSLKGSSGFNTWMDGVQDKIPGIIGLLESLAQIGMKLAEAFMPVSAVTLKLVEAFAAMVSAIPQEAFNTFIPILVGAAVAMRLFGAAAAFATGALAATPIGSMIVALGALVGALIATGNANDLLNSSFGRMGDGAQSATDKMLSTAAGMGDAALNIIKWVDTLGGLMPDMAGSTDQAANSMGDFADSADFASTQVGDFTDKVRESANAALELSGTQIGLEAAFDDAAKAANRNGKNLDISTEAGRANRTALDNVASAALRVKDKMEASGASATDVGARMNSARSNFVNLAMSMRLSRGQANALANSLGLIRSKTVTIVTIFKNIGTSNAGITSGTAHAAMATKASGGIVGYAAEGGPRGGLVLVGEQGPELVRLAPGSMVHSAGDTRRMQSYPPRDFSQDSAAYNHNDDPTVSLHLTHSYKGANNKAALLMLKQLTDAIDDKITTIRTKFNSVISIIKQKFDGSQEDALVSYAKKNLAALEKLAIKRDAVAAKLADARKYASDLAQSVKSFASLSSMGEDNSTLSILANLKDKLAKMQEFNAALKALAKRGLSKDLYQQIAEQGPEQGLTLANNFLAMEPYMFDEANSLQSKINNEAKATGANSAEYLYSVKALEKQEASFQRAMDKAADKFTDKIAAALAKLARNPKGKASGGPTGGMTWVGEQGPELLDLPYGSSVYSAGDSRRMSGNSNGPISIQLEWVGSNGGDEFMTWLRRNIRAVAGNGSNSVQTALS